MDIDKTLSNFIYKEDLVTFIRTLPDESRGVLCFTVPTGETDEDGDETEAVQYRSYGAVNCGEAVLLGMEIIDFARGIN